MAVGPIGSSVTGPAGAAGTGSASAASRPAAAPRPKAGVVVTLSPEARQHLSRLEGFAATIGTPKQPKQMASPGISIDLKA